MINKSKRFDFNWNKEKTYSVYELKVQSLTEPLGLISIERRPADFAYEIRLLASSKENIGPAKMYQRIAGCLISFACVESFKAGYGGYVCLKPKTELKNHYQEVYGMISTKLYMVTEGQNSLRLIKEYYENDES